MMNTIAKNNPSLKHTLKEFIDAGKASTEISYYSTSILDGNQGVMYSIDNVIFDYLDELKSISQLCMLDYGEYQHYMYDGVYLLAYDLYKSRDLAYIILAINGIYDSKDFIMNPVRLIRRDLLAEILSQIYNAERGYIGLNREKMGLM